MDKLLRKEWMGSIVAMVGMLLLLFSPFYGNYVSRTVFGVLFIFSFSSLVAGLIVAGKYSLKRRETRRTTFYNAYTECLHCSGKGWIRKEK
jgi:drug/metabolite transporter (DMT)-like permease